MIKALSAIAVAALIATGLTILPGFAPQVEASVPMALAKADRLDVRPVGRDCSQQAWPNFEASCLRTAARRTAHTGRAALPRGGPGGLRGGPAGAPRRKDRQHPRGPPSYLRAPLSLLKYLRVA